MQAAVSEPYCFRAPHRIVQIHVGTTTGVRLEALSVPMPATTRHIVLQPSNGFASDGVRLRMWGAPACRLVTASDEAEEEEEYEEEPRHEEDAVVPHNKRARTHAPRFIRRQRARAAEADEEWLLDMTDERPERVGYIWLLPSSPYTATCGRGQIELAYPPHDFRIENACGACILEEPLHRAWLRPFMVETRHTPLITTLGGTFAPCAKQSMQVDYRGVRSVAAMEAAWNALRLGDVARTQIYMLVLKASLGLPVMLFDAGTLPPGLEGEGARIAAMGRGICFLAEGLAPWYKHFEQNIDACVTLELHGVKWVELFPDVAEPLRRARTSMHLSRRGGVILRLLFSRHTEWSAEVEAAVVRDCDRLLACVRRLLAGRRWRP